MLKARESIRPRLATNQDSCHTDLNDCYLDPALADLEKLSTSFGHKPGALNLHEKREIRRCESRSVLGIQTGASEAFIFDLKPSKHC